MANISVGKRMGGALILDSDLGQNDSDLGQNDSDLGENESDLGQRRRRHGRGAVVSRRWSSMADARANVPQHPLDNIALEPRGGLDPGRHQVLRVRRDHCVHVLPLILGDGGTATATGPAQGGVERPVPPGAGA